MVNVQISRQIIIEFYRLLWEFRNSKTRKKARNVIFVSKKKNNFKFKNILQKSWATIPPNRPPIPAHVGSRIISMTLVCTLLKRSKYVFNGNKSISLYDYQLVTNTTLGIKLHTRTRFFVKCAFPSFRILHTLSVSYNLFMTQLPFKKYV